jgi:hypothetical protein
VNHVFKRIYLSRYRIHFVPLSSANCDAHFAHHDRRDGFGGLAGDQSATDLGALYPNFSGQLSGSIPLAIQSI